MAAKVGLKGRRKGRRKQGSKKRRLLHRIKMRKKRNK